MPRTMRCHICHTRGKTDYSTNDDLRNLRVCFSTDCCKKYLYVCDNDGESHDCEDKSNIKLHKFIKERLCPICGKRQYWNIFEKIGFGFVFSFVTVVGCYFLGKVICPTRSTIVQTLAGMGMVSSCVISGVVIIGSMIYYNSRNSDVVPDEDEDLD